MSKIILTRYFNKIFLLIGILIQLIVFYITDNSWLSLISGVSGIISVVLCSQRKLSFYWWGFLQLFTYVYLCYEQHLWGEIIENIFYFITMIWGIYLWKSNYKNEQVETRTLGKNNLVVFNCCMLFILILYWILSKTNDTQPCMDAITTVPAFFAQILMILRYKEQWLYWIIIDIASIIMWGIAGNIYMVTQFIFWTCNCVYGWYLWNNNKIN